MKRVPLHGYRGVIRTYALIDDEDFAAVAEKRWHLLSVGYAASGRWGLMHRFLLGLQAGDGKRTDHVNGNKLDNRRANIRVCTQAENMQNWRVRNAASRTSQHRGVSLDRKTRNHRKVWIAQVMLQGKQHFLGRFETEEDAAAAAAAFRAARMPFSIDDSATG